MGRQHSEKILHPEASFSDCLFYCNKEKILNMAQGNTSKMFFSISEHEIDTLSVSSLERERDS